MFLEIELKSFSIIVQNATEKSGFFVMGYFLAGTVGTGGEHIAFKGTVSPD